MHRETFVTPAGAAQTVSAHLAFGTVLARTGTARIAIECHVTNVIYRRMPPVIDRIHLVEALMPAHAVTIYANIEILREQLLATIAMHVALGYLRSTAFASNSCHHGSKGRRVSKEVFRRFFRRAFKVSF